MIKPGIYKSTELTSEEYHGDMFSYSRTSLMQFKRNACGFKKIREQPKKDEKDTPDTIFGKAFHTFVMEPHLFDSQFVVEPERVYLKYDGKEKFEAYKVLLEEIESGNRVVLSNDEFIRLKEMKQALWDDEDARRLIEGAVYEQSYFWEDEHTGLMLKSRPDIINEGIYIDLKTTKDASPRGFQNAMAEYGNHIQAAMVKDGCHQVEGRKIELCINISIEKKFPYLVGNYRIDDAALEYGKCEYKQILLDLKSALTHNDFPGYGIQTIGLPSWYK